MFIRQKLLILLFFTSLVASYSLALAEGQPQQYLNPKEKINRQQAEIPAKDSAISADKFSGKLITSIQIKGNKFISTNVVISKMKTRAGSTYQENIISDDLKRLYLLGFFSDIKIDAAEYKNGVRVIVTVVERPIIEKITFLGLRVLTMKEDKLKGLLKSKETQYLDYPSLAEDLTILKKLYEKIGYNQAKIDYKVDIDKENSKANIEFIVVEGKRVSIKYIDIQGNKNYSDARILKLLKTKRGWLFNAGVLKDDVLAEDIERIKAFYRKNGFNDVAVTYGVSTNTQNAKKPFLSIAITIDEGSKYLVGSVTIRGNKDISEKDIRAKVKACAPGKVFSQEAMKQDIADIQGLYFDRGYISAQVREDSSLNPLNKRIDIAYNIEEFGISYVDKIKVKGNVKTKDIVVRREVRLRPGDKFDGEKLRRSKERLQNLGFFEEVSYDTEDTPVENKKNLVVEVKETKTGAFSFGGGYSTVEQFIGFVEVEQKNFDWRNFPYFTGAGQNLKFRASMGQLSNDFDISFTEPWMFDYPVSFGFDGYRRSHQRDSGVGYGYDDKVTGGDLRLGKELSEYIRADATYRFDMIKISNISSNATSSLTNEYGTTKISSLELGLTYDSRNSIADTTRGNLLNGSAECAGGPFGADRDYYKFFTRVSHYFPLFNESALELRGRLGIANAYGDSEQIPIYERFFAGGANTVRGYEERRLGPIDPVSNDPLGGEATFVGNIEYLYPVFSFLKVAVFFDTGNVWQKSSKIFTTGLKSGYGIGVRMKTPVGPVMVDYGIPLNKEPGEHRVKDGQWHFNVSQGF